MAMYLGISTKTIQSYEQGWRRIPAAVERQVLYCLTRLNRKLHPDIRDCWHVKECGGERRKTCLVDQLGAGEECWFVSGNVCDGAAVENWERKRRTCFRCRVFLQHLQFLEGDPLYEKILGD